MVNEHYLDCSLVHVGINCGMNLFLCMPPIVTKGIKRIQVHVNHKAWKLICKNQSKQYMVMIENITKSDLLKEYGENPIPMWLDPTNCRRLKDFKLVGITRCTQNKRG